jgi:hypothetical protein
VAGYNAAETVHGVAARLGATVNSGDGFWATRCAGITTSDAGMLLTSLRGSWTASRGRGSNDGGGTTAAARELGLGFQRLAV